MLEARSHIYMSIRRAARNSWITSPPNQRDMLYLQDMYQTVWYILIFSTLLPPARARQLLLSACPTWARAYIIGATQLTAYMSRYCVQKSLSAMTAGRHISAIHIISVFSQQNWFWTILDLFPLPAVAQADVDIRTYRRCCNHDGKQTASTNLYIYTAQDTYPACTKIPEILISWHFSE